MVENDPAAIRSELLKNMNADGFSTPSEIEKTTLDDQDKANGPKVEEQYRLKSLKSIKADTSNYVEKMALLHVLNRTGWNKSETAKILKISYKTLFTKIYELGIKKRN